MLNTTDQSHERLLNMHVHMIVLGRKYLNLLDHMRVQSEHTYQRFDPGLYMCAPLCVTHVC